MARALRVAFFLASLALAAPALAQDGGAPQPVVRVVRPPEGSMRRGALPAPEWAVYACSGAMIVAAAGVLVWRTLTRRR